MPARIFKILIIDDDDIVLLVQKKFIQRCGFATEVLSFKGGQKALEYLKDNNNNEDYLILLDINMPVINGWQFLDHLEDMNFPKDIYVIMVTSNISEKDKEVAGNYERVIGFLEKPVSLKHCTEIKTMLQIKEYF